MNKKLCFVTNSTDFSLLETSNVEIFSFDYESHKNLEKLDIKHSIAEEFLDDNERFELFDKVKEFRDWYDNPSLPKFELQGVNIFSLLDGMEFHELLMQKLIVFFTIKKILNKNNPTSIVCPHEMIMMIKLLSSKSQVQIESNSGNEKKELFWDSINVKRNIAGRPISIKISRTKYNKLKNLLDKTVGITYRLYFDFKNKNKKTILLLEMYPPVYKELIQNLKNEDYNIIIINRRRPVTLEKESIKILQNSNCKLISMNDLIKKDDLEKISLFTNEYSLKIDEIWDKEQNFKQVFRFDNIVFWDLIKNDLKEVFQRRIGDYVELVFFIKKIYETINVRKILSLYETGETERAFLVNKDPKIKSYLLEHGFSLLFKETQRFGMISSYDKFSDKILVWSDFQKQFLNENYNISMDKIFPIGSPRHDTYSMREKVQRNNKEITILIAPTPITQNQGFDTTEIHETYEKTIKKLCLNLQKENINLIFKIHPSQSPHNEEIKKIIQTYASDSPIYLLNPIIDLIQSSDIVINISPQGWAPSTIMLESMILGKPTLNIVLDRKFFDFKYIKENAAVSIPYDKIEKVISKLINDVSYREELSKNAIHFTKKFLCNYGNASKMLANKLLEKNRRISE